MEQEMFEFWDERSQLLVNFFQSKRASRDPISCDHAMLTCGWGGLSTRGRG